MHFGKVGAHFKSSGTAGCHTLGKHEVGHPVAAEKGRVANAGDRVGDCNPGHAGAGLKSGGANARDFETVNFRRDLHRSAGAGISADGEGARIYG